jgi:two-component system, cell cycle sensor histidine kinase and response regulator CckA
MQMQAMELTASEAAEVALRDSEARYRTLAEAAHDSIFIVDAAGRIEYVNAVGCEHFRRTAADTTGRSLWDVLPPATADEVWRQLSVALESNQRHYFEARLEMPSGKKWFGTWCAPMLGDRSSAAVMGVCRDITDRKHLEREFAQAQKMEAVGRLAGGVAHDFNNLLTAIIGYSDILAETLRTNADLMESLEEVRKAGHRASQLTGQLLAFSRKSEPSATTIDLNALVTDLEKMLRRVIGEDVALDVITDPSLAPITADGGQLEQMIVNLVVNARDAMPDGGRLRIATANAVIDDAFAQKHPGVVPGEYVAVTVQDSGCGMPPDVVARVFEPFFTTKPEGQGTGLGLSTVAGIVKRIGGSITIDSTPGCGTTFAIYLPVQQNTLREMVLHG